MHAAPTNLAFGRQPFAEILRHAARFAERLRDELCVAFRILRPITHATRRIDADDAIRTHAELAQLARDAAGLEHLTDEIFAFLGAAHGRTAAGRLPDRGNDRAYDEAKRTDLFAKAFQIIVADIDADMRVVKKQVHPIEFHAIDGCIRSQQQHGVQVDARFGAGAAFAHQTRPHRVM